MLTCALSACGSPGDQVVTASTAAVTPATATPAAIDDAAEIVDVDTYAYGTAPCPAADGSSSKPASFAGAPSKCIEPGVSYSAVVTTNFGAFTIALAADAYPGTVNNFVTLARYHYYDNSGCHRVLMDFVVQCGRPGDDESAPGYTIPDQLPSAQAEYFEGVVAMANIGSPDTGGGQWFIITGPSGASLPPQYSIVGKVVEGYDTTVQALENQADSNQPTGVPTLTPITIESVVIQQTGP